MRAVVAREDGEQMQAREIMDFCRGEATGYKIPRSSVFNTRCRSRGWASCSVKKEWNCTNSRID